MGCIGCQSCMAQAYNAIFHAPVKLRCSCELCVSLKSLLGSEALAELCRWCAGSPSAAMASLRARSSATTATLMGAMGAHLSARCFPALCLLHAFMPKMV